MTPIALLIAINKGGLVYVDVNTDSVQSGDRGNLGGKPQGEVNNKTLCRKWQEQTDNGRNTWDQDNHTDISAFY